MSLEMFQRNTEIVNQYTFDPHYSPNEVRNTLYELYTNQSADKAALTATITKQLQTIESNVFMTTRLLPEINAPEPYDMPYGSQYYEWALKINTDPFKECQIRNAQTQARLLISELNKEPIDYLYQRTNIQASIEKFRQNSDLGNPDTPYNNNLKISGPHLYLESQTLLLELALQEMKKAPQDSGNTTSSVPDSHEAFIAIANFMQQITIEADERFNLDSLKNEQINQNLDLRYVDAYIRARLLMGRHYEFFDEPQQAQIFYEEALNLSTRFNQKYPRRVTPVVLLAEMNKSAVPFLIERYKSQTELPSIYTNLEQALAAQAQLQTDNSKTQEVYITIALRFEDLADAALDRKLVHVARYYYTLAQSVLMEKYIHGETLGNITKKISALPLQSHPEIGVDNELLVLDTALQNDDKAIIIKTFLNMGQNNLAAHRPLLAGQLYSQAQRFTTDKVWMHPIDIGRLTWFGLRENSIAEYNQMLERAIAKNETILRLQIAVDRANNYIFFEDFESVEVALANADEALSVFKHGSSAEAGLAREVSILKYELSIQTMKAVHELYKAKVVKTKKKGSIDWSNTDMYWNRLLTANSLRETAERIVGTLKQRPDFNSLSSYVSSEIAAFYAQSGRILLYIGHNNNLDQKQSNFSGALGQMKLALEEARIEAQKNKPTIEHEVNSVLYGQIFQICERVLELIPAEYRDSTQFTHLPEILPAYPIISSYRATQQTV